jgi:hypothetical protein
MNAKFPYFFNVSLMFTECCTVQWLMAPFMMFMLPEGLVAFVALFFLQIHMAKCSAPSPGTWPVGWCEPIRNQKELRKFRPSPDKLS